LFSGIVKELCPVSSVKTSPDLLTFSLTATPQFCDGLQIGASVAVDGVCLTVVSLYNGEITFDVIPETLKKTTLDDLFTGRVVGCERSLRMGDEIGGHLLSGHVWGVASIHKIECNVMTIACPQEWMRYILPKGFIALDGASLTVVDVSEAGFFTVHLIPETLRMTALGLKKEGNSVNLEIDSRTQAMIDSYRLENLNRV